MRPEPRLRAPGARPSRRAPRAPVSCLPWGVRVVCSCAALGSAGSSAYESVEVQDGGSLHGAVRFAGKPPAPARLEVTRDQNVCGRSAEDVSLVVGKDGGLANV